MPRKHPQPFWREARSCWFVQLGGKQVRLSPDREEAFRLYHELMARPRAAAASVAATAPASPLVVEVLDAFLDWVKANQAPRTFRWYQDFIQKFVSSVPASLAVAELRPYHITRAMDAQAKWAANTKNGFARAVQRGFRWALKQGLIDTNPVAVVEKPGQERREEYVTPEDFERLLSWWPRGSFRDLLVAAWETGARPQELLAVEARHVDVEGRRWVFKVKESKGKSRNRIVFLTDRAFEITRRLMKLHPQGKLFRNEKGEPWNKFAVHNRFARKNRRFKTKYCLYMLRHGFATRMLMAGVDTTALAMIMGHKDAVMISRVYQHLAQRPDFLHEKLREANLVANGGAPAS